ncbi:MAG: FMN-binding protein [Oscillospiraceae bacterium]|nr:FMN-binding protein [Oscillospiraceae bacterium]
MTDKKKVFLSPEKKKELLHTTLILAGILAVVSLALSGLNMLLRQSIDKAEMKPFVSAMSRICPAESYEETDYEHSDAGGVYALYKAYNGTELAGYCVETRANGINRDLRVAVGIDKDGKILKTEIISERERQSAGTKTTDEEFLSQFEGKSGEVTFVNGKASRESEIYDVVGSDISSPAVVDAVNRASLAVGNLREKEEKEAAEE